MNVLLLICTVVGVLAVIFFILSILLGGVALIWDSVKKLTIGIILVVIVVLIIGGIMTL